jgi:SAM-dependent methyltransferase
MAYLQNKIKSLGQQMGIGRAIKELSFQLQRAQYYSRNRLFKKNNPTVLIPNDRWLFETFQLDYQKYFTEGELCAKEIMEWTKPYLPIENLLTILDWGCGAGRVIQHIHQYSPYALLYGADTNKEMIAWNQSNIKGIHFMELSNHAISPFPNDFFNLIYGISVFTHIPNNDRKKWQSEFCRTLKPGGILVLSTHGRYYYQNLLKQEIKQLELNGFLDKVFPIDHNNKGVGDRNFSSYQTQEYLENQFSPLFTILHYYDGVLFPEKMGGQDLWILQRKQIL